MTDGPDDSPGLIWRLDVKDRDGVSLRGYPRIFLQDREYVQHLGRMMNKSYEKNLGYTFVKEGCTRSAWMNLDGPVVHIPEVEGSSLPPVIVFYDAA